MCFRTCIATHRHKGSLESSSHVTMLTLCKQYPQGREEGNVRLAPGNFKTPPPSEEHGRTQSPPPAGQLRGGAAASGVGGAGLCQVSGEGSACSGAGRPGVSRPGVGLLCLQVERIRTLIKTRGRAGAGGRAPLPPWGGRARGPPCGRSTRWPRPFRAGSPTSGVGESCHF